MRRWLLRALYAALACTILVLVVRIWAGSVADDRLATEVARIRAAGEPVNLPEAAPPPVADVENAAVLLQAAFDMSQDMPDEYFGLWREWEDTPFDASAKTVAGFSAWVKANETALEVAAEALQRPHCRFGRNWSSARRMEFLEIAGLHRLSRLWKSRALLRARVGELDLALEDCGRILRLGTLASQHPLLIDLLVSMGLDVVGTGAAQEILQRGRPGKSALQSLLARVADVPREEQLRRAAVLERAYVNSVFNEAVENPSDIEGSLLLGTEWSTMQGIALRVLPTAMIRLDQARFLTRMYAALALMEKPYRESRDAWKSLNADADDKPWYAGLSTSALTLNPFLAWKVAQHAARLDLLELGLRVELHRLEHGTLPDALEELVLPALPQDRFRRAPNIYRRLPEDGYLIYSVGPNGVDDGGVDGGDDIEEQGDLVWRR